MILTAKIGYWRKSIKESGINVEQCSLTDERSKQRIPFHGLHFLTVMTLSKSSVSSCNFCKTFHAGQQAISGTPCCKKLR
jgi:hypothetical protein